MLPSGNGQKEIVQILLDKSADVIAANNRSRGFTALMIAVLKNHKNSNR